MESERVPAYTAPPIIEAVVQIMYAEPLSLPLYRKLIKRLKRGYANATSQQQVSANFDLQTQQARFESMPQERFSSGDEADVLIVQQGALTWSRLAPYQGWDNLLERIKRDASDALSVTKYRKLSRVGVRYINRIDVMNEENVAMYEDYFAINIDLPPSIPEVKKYAWRFEREIVDKNLLVIVQSASTVPEIPNSAAFLLDIDVVAFTKLPAKLDDLYKRLEEMREVKNEHFELSIREKARAKFFK